MSEFINTIDVIGDEELCKRIIIRTVTEYKDNAVTSIGQYAFNGCTSLTGVDIPAVTNIKDNAFQGCKGLTSVDIPTVTSIDQRAFIGCTGLPSITFKSTPTSIASNAFQNCSNLLTINVPWAEGAVSGAPWGATNATINYNYTGV